NIDQGTNPSGLYSGTSGGKLRRHAHGGRERTPRPMDTVHGRILLCRWLQDKTDTHQSIRDGVHLCSKVLMQQIMKRNMKL
ncbi:hypothetical protein Tco_0311050, partial [Tanacetum coccineum]